MKLFVSQEQLRHYPERVLVNGFYSENLEKPERISRLISGGIAAGYVPTEPQCYGMGPIAVIHSSSYLDFLRTAHERWSRLEGASDVVTPNVRPISRDDACPDHIIAQAGYYLADGDCVITTDTWDSICWSAWSAVGAADAILAGDTIAYALCRPPGHHAGWDTASGFCFFNNAAIAAERLRSRYPRIAIIDVDAHHGNGTQSIFYSRGDVFTASIHVDPAGFYPFYRGYSEERGEGPGIYCNFNMPLPRGTGDEPYLDALELVLEHTQKFRPDALVVALGLDAAGDDPYKGLNISADGFERIATAIAKALPCPTVLVQEGGYDCESLNTNLTRFLLGISNDNCAEPILEAQEQSA